MVPQIPPGSSACLASILRSRDHSTTASSGESWCTVDLNYSLEDTPPPSCAPAEVRRAPDCSPALSTHIGLAMSHRCCQGHMPGIVHCW